MVKSKQMAPFYRKYQLFAMLMSVIIITSAVFISFRDPELGRDWIVFFSVFFVFSLGSVFVTLYYYSLQQHLNFLIVLLLQVAFALTLFFFDAIRASMFHFVIAVSFQTRGTYVHNYIILGFVAWVVGFVLLQSLLFGQNKEEDVVSNQFPLLMIIWAFYLGSWFAYIYMEEQGKKLEFMQHYRK